MTIPICRGQYSIQQEINNIASSSGKGWAERIRDHTWREQTRLQLLASSDVWCDYKQNTCHCESWYRPNFTRHKTSLPANLFN